MKNFKIKLEEKSGYLLLTLGGNFDANWAMAVGDKVDFKLQEISGGTSLDIDLVIDLTEVDYISSGALRVLLGLEKKMKGAGRRLVICNPSSRVSEIMKTVGMYGHFIICPSVNSALSALKTMGKGFSSS